MPLKYISELKKKKDVNTNDHVRDGDNMYLEGTGN